MAKGSEAKTYIQAKLIEMFDNAFIASDGKTIRIPYVENGEVVEIKVTLTAAKDIEGGAEIAPVTQPEVSAPAATTNAVKLEPTDEEKENLKRLMASLF